jgi:ABC-type siderophore export system fused ATPase/permease subunit
MTGSQAREKAHAQRNNWWLVAIGGLAALVGLGLLWLRSGFLNVPLGIGLLFLIGPLLSVVGIVLVIRERMRRER